MRFITISFSLAVLDQKLFLSINREWTSPALDLFMAAMSSWSLFIAPVLVLAVLLFLRGNFRARVAVLLIAASVGLADGAIVGPLKGVAGRPRPNAVLTGTRMVDLAKTRPRVRALFRDPEVKLSRPRPGRVEPGRSFPSGHTTDNFCAAIMLTFFFRRWGWAYFGVAALVGYSRIYTGSHWPSDVLISSFLGVGLGILFTVLAEWGWRKLGPRLAPGWHARYPQLVA